MAETPARLQLVEPSPVPPLLPDEPPLSGVPRPGHHCRVTKCTAAPGMLAVESVDAQGALVARYEERAEWFDETMVERMRERLHANCCTCRQIKRVK